MKVRVVIDVEMCRVRARTKGYPHRNEIIQIGAVMMNEAYEVLDKFSTFVKPRFGSIDRYILRLTGISDKNIKNAPDVEKAFEELLQWAGNNEVLFYSWSDADYHQIRNEIMWKCKENRRWELLLDRNNWIDYQKSFGERLGSAKLLKLTEALEWAEVDTEGHLHDGLDDAYNTALMISKLETDKNYQTIIERVREKEKNQAPLTMSLGSMMQGFVLEPA